MSCAEMTAFTNSWSMGYRGTTGIEGIRNNRLFGFGISTASIASLGSKTYESRPTGFVREFASPIEVPTCE